MSPDSSYQEQQMDIESVLKKYETSEAGLSQTDAESRLSRYGKNELQERKREPLWKKFLSQFTNSVMYILIIAGIISLVLGLQHDPPEYKDAIAIFFAVFIAGTLGFIMEYRGDKALEKLKEMTQQQVRVRRGGSETLVVSSHLVPGDIVLLEEGMKVPADMRVIKALNLSVNESMLTGESVAVEKGVAPGEDTVVYMGTIVVKGRGEGVVIATGMQTRMGHIAELVERPSDEQTPLQKSLDELGTKIARLVIIAAALFFILSTFLLSYSIEEMLLIAVVLAVAGVPEGLPTTIAVTLALGVLTMAKRNAIVRKMSAVEDLGHITVICTDKTGTLTKNEMTPHAVFVNGRFFSFSQGKYEGPHDATTSKLFDIALIANNASFGADGLIGDPTETALLVAAMAYDEKLRERKHIPLLHENGFDSTRKMMSVVFKENDRPLLYLKGAPENVLSASTSIEIDGTVRPLTSDIRKTIEANVKEKAAQGMRLIACAYRSSVSDYQDERELVFVGFFALYDPPRPEARAALEACHDAGITVYMVTGDTRETAMTIARETGFPSLNAMAGEDFVSLDEEGRRRALETTRVFYRVSPSQKYEIVSTLKSHGHVVAVTGDGVNDAPAMNRADVGIAMGRGSDVTKETAKVILVDENFATFVHAIEYGRKLYESIKNFIRFQFTTTISVMTSMFSITVLAIGEPFRPIQILFINIIMDGPPAVSLGIEHTARDVMKHPPTDPNAPFLDKLFFAIVVLDGLFITAMIALLWLLMPSFGIPSDLRETTAFTAMVFFQLFNAYNCRSMKDHFWVDLHKSPYLILSTIGSAIILLLFLLIPDISGYLSVKPLPLDLIAGALLYASSILVFAEVRKFVMRKQGLLW